MVARAHRQLDTGETMDRRMTLAIRLAALVFAAIATPLAAQFSSPTLTAAASNNVVELPTMHSAVTRADGVTIAAQAFYSSASDLADRALPELTVQAGAQIRVAAEPEADSLWVTPVVNGVRVPASVTGRTFSAPTLVGRYEYFVSGQWAAHPDGTRPPSGYARVEVWALRVVVR